MTHHHDDGYPRNGASGDAANIQRHLRVLAERFPDVPIVSVYLMERDETFRELCEDYEACVSTVERLRNNAADAAMLKEYCALQLRLESELLRYVSEHRSGNVP